MIQMLGSRFSDMSNRIGAALATRIKPSLTNLCEEHSQLKNDVFALETQLKEEMRVLLRNASVAVEEFFSKSKKNRSIKDNE